MPNEADAVGQPFIDEHGWNYGIVVQTPAGRRLWLNGKLGPVFRDFVDAPIADAGLVFVHKFSEDGKRLAYAIRQNAKMAMVVDGKPEPPEQEVGRPTFSPDGRHLAYEVKRDGKFYVLLDGVPGPQSDGVCGQIFFSPNSRRIAYVVRHGKETVLVVDQKEQRGWPNPWDPVFSPDGKHLAYTSIKGFAVLDGVKGPEFPANTCWGPVFSLDSRHCAYTIGNRTSEIRQERAFIDWSPLPLPNNGTNVWHVAFSPDLKRWGCILQDGGEAQVFLEGRYGPVFRRAWGLCFSPDSSRYAYKAETQGNWWMVVDGNPEAQIEPRNPVFSPNGKRVAYIAGSGPVWWVMVDGKSSRKLIGPKRSPGLFESEQRETPAFTTPTFSPDSAHLAYGYYETDKWALWLDNQAVGRKYAKIIPGGPSFHENGTLEFLAIADQVLYRFSARPRPQARGSDQTRR